MPNERSLHSTIGTTPKLAISWYGWQGAGQYVNTVILDRAIKRAMHRSLVSTQVEWQTKKHCFARCFFLCNATNCCAKDLRITFCPRISSTFITFYTFDHRKQLVKTDQQYPARAHAKRYAVVKNLTTVNRSFVNPT